MCKDEYRLVCIDNSDDFDSAKPQITKNDLILSFDLNVLHLCEKNGFLYVDLKEILGENTNSGQDYIEFTSFIENIVESIKLDYQDLFGNSSHTKVYDWFLYTIKITMDQVFIYKKTLEKLFNTYSISEVLVNSEALLTYNDQLIVDPQTSLLSLVAQDVAKKYKCKRISFYNRLSNNKNFEPFSFGGVKSTYCFLSNHFSRSIRSVFWFFYAVYSITPAFLDKEKKTFFFYRL